MSDDNESGGWLLPILIIGGIGLWYWWNVKNGKFEYPFGKGKSGTGGGSGPLPIPGNPTLAVGLTGKTAAQLKNEFNLIVTTGKVPPSVATTESDFIQWQKDVEKATFDSEYKRTMLATGNIAAANGAGLAAVAELRKTLSNVGYTLSSRN